MPIYDFYCKDCDKAFSVFVSMTEKVESCTLCTSENIVREIEGLSSVLRGENFESRTGDVVKEHIEEGKRDLKKEKELLKKEIL